MSHIPYRLACLICLLTGIAFQGDGQNISGLIREADKYFEHDKFRSALQYYKQGGNPETWKKDTKLRVAICQYEVNEVDGAMVLLTDLIREGKTEEDVFLYLARCYHHQHQFRSAVHYYKEYLRRNDKESPLRDWVKDEVLRCANGINLRYATELAYVENMGAAINSLHDDFTPVPSPNYSDRLYFTSARENSEGGLMNASGFPDPKYGSYRTDMFYAENANGVWHKAISLDHVLNSRLYEEILCFSLDGQQMYFRRGREADRGDLVVDTFATASQLGARAVSLGPFQPQRGDKDLFLYNDTIMLFASHQAGGLGGYDLFYSVKRRGKWRDAVNLGPGINSFYDDSSPFLTRNGRQLYFSSNRLESIGGLDVFRATYDDATLRWLPPVNPGMPVNSAGDDAHFRLAIDGLKAFLSSDRKSAFGQRDLFVAYFKEQVREHLTLSVPLTFIHLQPEKPKETDVASTSDKQKVREYVISDLWYEPNDLVLTPQNIKKLEVLTNLLLIYPTLKADLIGHDVPSGPRSYDLFFSVKKAEQVAEYLYRKGIAQNRIYIKGGGTFYPIAASVENGVRNPSIDRLNRRIELHVYNVDAQPVILTMEQANVPETLRSSAGTRFNTLQDQLVYRIQIASTQHLYQHDVFDDYQDALVHYDPAARTYQYFIGMETMYDNAATIRDRLQSEGFPQAFIIPYIEGRQLVPGEASQYLERFPDLLNFIERN